MYHGEKFNAMTHLVGAVLALAGAIVLVVLAAMGGDPWKVIGVAIYGLTLVMLYSFSVLYHSLRAEVRRNQRRDVQGVVQLGGFVSSAAAESTAVAVARKVEGVKSVKNDMRLK